MGIEKIVTKKKRKKNETVGLEHKMLEGGYELFVRERVSGK